MNLSRKAFNIGLIIAALLSVGLVAASFLPIIGDKTGYAGYLAIFALMVAPWVFGILACILAFGRVKNIGLHSGLAAIFPVLLANGPALWLTPGNLFVALLIPLMLLPTDAVQRSSTTSSRLPMAFLSASVVTAILIQMAVSVMGSFVLYLGNQVAGGTVVASSIWVWSSLRKPGAPAEAHEFTAFVGSSFRGTPWGILFGVALLVSTGMHAATSLPTEMDPLFVPLFMWALGILPTALLIAALLVAIYQVAVRPRAVAVALLVLATVPFAHWAVLRLDSIKPDEVRVELAGPIEGVPAIGAVVSDERELPNSITAKLKDIVGVHHLVTKAGDDEYRWDSKGVSRTSTLSEALGGQAAIMFSRPELEGGWQRALVSLRLPDGTVHPLSARTWRKTSRHDVLAFPVLFPGGGWARDYSGRATVAHEETAVRDAIKLLGR